MFGLWHFAETRTMISWERRNSLGKSCSIYMLRRGQAVNILVILWGILRTCSFLVTVHPVHPHYAVLLPDFRKGKELIIGKQMEQQKLWEAMNGPPREFSTARSWSAPSTAGFTPHAGPAGACRSSLVKHSLFHCHHHR